MTEAFREYVTAWLAATGCSATYLGERSGLSQSLLSKYLLKDPDRRVTPSPKSLQKLAPVLDVPYEDLMRMCGHLPGTPRTQINAQHQAVHEQVERWIAAVGPQNEAYFWRHLKSQGDSTVDLLRRLGTAVNAAPDTAVNEGVSASDERDNRLDGGADRALSADYRHRKFRLADAFRTTTSVAAA